jgi:hypothetical protein
VSNTNNDTSERFKTKVFSFTLLTTQSHFVNTLYRLLSRDIVSIDALKLGELDASHEGVRLEMRRGSDVVVHTPHGEALTLNLQQIAPERLKVLVALKQWIGVGFKVLQSVAVTYREVEQFIQFQLSFEALGFDWLKHFYSQEADALERLGEFLFGDLLRAHTLALPNSVGDDKTGIPDRPEWNRGKGAAAVFEWRKKYRPDMSLKQLANEVGKKHGYVLQRHSKWANTLTNKTNMQNEHGVR